ATRPASAIVPTLSPFPTQQANNPHVMTFPLPNRHDFTPVEPLPEFPPAPFYARSPFPSPFLRAGVAIMPIPEGLGNGIRPVPHPPTVVNAVVATPPIPIPQAPPDPPPPDPRFFNMWHNQYPVPFPHDWGYRQAGMPLDHGPVWPLGHPQVPAPVPFIDPHFYYPPQPHACVQSPPHAVHH
ncbi:hypothetical protein C0993_011268, partial [Termitomyces sp. T159_Od127]